MKYPGTHPRCGHRDRQRARLRGTSIALVSAKCGLPASSIYWHFKDKDDLIAAVIERSFAQWFRHGRCPSKAPHVSASSAWPCRSPRRCWIPRLHAARPDARAGAPAGRAAGAGDVLDSQRRRSRAGRNHARLLPPASPTHRSISWPPTRSPAPTGSFIAKEIGGDSVDLLALFEMHARALYDSAALDHGRPVAAKHDGPYRSAQRAGCPTRGASGSVAKPADQGSRSRVAGIP